MLDQVAQSPIQPGLEHFQGGASTASLGNLFQCLTNEYSQRSESGISQITKEKKKGYINVSFIKRASFTVPQYSCIRLQCELA